jgi:plasmid maintenance system killer protein
MTPLDFQHQVILLLAAHFDAAACLNALQVPPGNRLEPLRGNRHVH